MIKPGDILRNDELCEIFKCSPQGGMRKSKRTNTLIIITHNLVSLYENRWENNVLHYTGMGSTGDQSINFMQNKTLAESGHNGYAVHLFEAFKPREYTYIGQVKLAGEPYQETQPDREGKARKVWMFPVTGVDAPLVVDKAEITKSFEKKLKEASKLTNEELLDRADNSSSRSNSRMVVSYQYNRSADVTEYVKRRANGICELCEEQGPFLDKTGKGFLEVHHIEWLSENGEDSITNAVALCPNCHRKMHHLKNKDDIKKLKSINFKINAD